MMDYEILLARAYEEATKSPDPSNQNGAVVIDANEDFVVADCNRFPPGFEMEPHEYMETGSTADLPADERRQNKYDNIEHAERFVCYRSPSRELNDTLICPWSACHPCARAIVLAGFKRLVVHRQRILHTPERWLRDVQVANAKMARQIEIIEVDGSIHTEAIVKVNGRPWSPRTLEFVD